MAVDAINLDRVSRLAVELAVAVIVLVEMAIDALHPTLEVDVLEVNGFSELLRVIVRNNLVVGVEELAFAIALVHGAENPAMAVEIGELRVIELRVELGRADVL